LGWQGSLTGDTRQYHRTSRLRLLIKKCSSVNMNVLSWRDTIGLKFDESNLTIHIRNAGSVDEGNNEQTSFLRIDRYQ